MKRWLALVTLAACALACTVDRRTDSLQCTTSNDCTSGRTCQQGYCVGGNGNGNCPSDCTSCNTSSDPPTCTIQHTGTDGKDVTCPSGYQCEIQCIGNNACGTVTCGPHQCQITCTGNNACNSVDCSDSCACQVQCTGGCGTNSCPTGKNNNACESNSTCTTSGAGCNAC